MTEHWARAREWHRRTLLPPLARPPEWTMSPILAAVSCRAPRQWLYPAHPGPGGDQSSVTSRILNHPGASRTRRMDTLPVPNTWPVYRPSIGDCYAFTELRAGMYGIVSPEFVPTHILLLGRGTGRTVPRPSCLVVPGTQTLANNRSVVPNNE